VTILAHQGGWDEVLWFILPALAGWWAIRWAGTRATERAEEAKRAAAARGEDDPTESG
jgi:hypothetical protein